MPKYREVFKLKAEFEPGYVFYTIKYDDVGKTSISTTAGTININQFMGGPVQKSDVDKRVYRINVAGVWQAENDRQRDERLAKYSKNRDQWPR